MVLERSVLFNLCGNGTQFVYPGAAGLYNAVSPKRYIRHIYTFEVKIADRVMHFYRQSRQSRQNRQRYIYSGNIVNEFTARINFVSTTNQTAGAGLQEQLGRLTGKIFWCTGSLLINFICYRRRQNLNLLSRSKPLQIYRVQWQQQNQYKNPTDLCMVVSNFFQPVIIVY